MTKINEWDLPFNKTGYHGDIGFRTGFNFCEDIKGRIIKVTRYENTNFRNNK